MYVHASALLSVLPAHNLPLRAIVLVADGPTVFATLTVDGVTLRSAIPQRELPWWVARCTIPVVAPAPEAPTDN